MRIFEVRTVSLQINSNHLAWSTLFGVFDQESEASRFADQLWLQMCEEEEASGRALTEAVFIHIVEDL